MMFYRNNAKLAAFVLALIAACCTACGSGALSAQAGREAMRKESSLRELLSRGDASAAIGDMIRAEQYYVSALKAGGDERKLVRRLLLVCTADQRYPAAAEYAEHYLHRYPTDVDLRFAAASIQLAVGNTHRARELLDSVLRERPDWAEAHYALASMMRAGGEPVASADLHDMQYLKLDPNGPLADTARARLSRRGTP
ncbi:MAG TPA: tetratricopeptide repeat protein [Polyangiaceae bacterium]|nr:tetratricopeptide repeat protein [Polyangiaceae bacterium]